MNLKVWLAGLCGLGAYAVVTVPAAPGQHVILARDYLEACETGEGECRPVIIRRAKGEWVSVDFPAVRLAKVSLWDSLQFKRFVAREKGEFLEQKYADSVSDKPHPITFDLTHRADGTYYLWLTSCGVGGIYTVRLKTQ